MTFFHSRWEHRMKVIGESGQYDLMTFKRLFLDLNLHVRVQSCGVTFEDAILQADCGVLFPVWNGRWFVRHVSFTAHVTSQGPRPFTLPEMTNAPAHEIMVLITYATAKAQVSLLIRADSPEPSLFAHMKYGSKRWVWLTIGNLAPLDSSTRAFEEWVYGGRKGP